MGLCLFFSHAPLLLLVLFTTLTTKPTSATNSITPTSPLSGNQTLTSQLGHFELGFFPLGNTTSPRFYIGIWYKNISLSQLTPVWVANRETPISDPTKSELIISSNGNLVLLNQFKTQVWSTNATSIASKTTIAVILDSGNLVLRDGSDPNKVFWQSFDHPTNTVLPGSKFGSNKVTGEYTQLTSWKNSDDPAPGIFSFSSDPNGSGNFSLKWNRSTIYWSTGLWNGHIFSQLPDMMMGLASNNYKFDFVSNATVTYFTFSVEGDSIISNRFLDFSGQLVSMVWVEKEQRWDLFWFAPQNPCDVFATCGPFSLCYEESIPFCSCVKGFNKADPRGWDLSDHSRGCVRKTQLQCVEKNDGFYPMEGTKLPDNPLSLEASTSEECELACLSNCSCTAYSYSNSCSVWYGELLNLQLMSDGLSGGTLNIRLAASDLDQTKKDAHGVVAWSIIGGVGGLFVCVAIVLVLLWRCRRRTEKVEGALIPFRYTDLKKMTKNFSEELGRGGFGSVLKGMMPDSTAIAVKRLEVRLHQGEKQFRAEVSTIGTIQHVNLIRLRGFCSQGTEKLLVYDYMPKGSLDKQLFNSATVLEWCTRYKIALGIARGLAYLHEECRDVILHCDIKPENILLDASFVPKVADFGMAKLLGRDFSRVVTTMRGTLGYLAPEWIYGTAITTKADVYSYGMMLLEIISGRRNMELYDKEGRPGFFLTLDAKLDHRLNGNANLEEVDRALKVSFWCIQDNEIYRPSMREVVQILEGIKEVSMPPIPKSLQLLAGDMERSLDTYLE